MISLVQLQDYLGMLAVAAGFGALGGLGFELLQSRVLAPAPAEPDTGTIEFPGWREDRRYLDLGLFGSIVLGAIAALGVLYFFPPQLTLTVTAADGTSKTSVQYDLVKVVGLSLLVGSAGPSVLSAMQTRVLALIKAKELNSKVNVANTQLDQLKTAASTELTSALQKAAAGARDNLSTAVSSRGRAANVNPDPAAVVDDAVAAITASAKAEFELRMNERIEAAKATVRSA